MPVGKLKTGRRGLAGKIRQAIGATPSEDVTIMTPQFERPASWPSVACPPADLEAFEALKTFDRNALLEIGLVPWDDTDDGKNTVWLFPAEWYRAIPAGFVVRVISGRDEVFVPGKTDNDTRFGALAYGIVGALNRKSPLPISGAEKP